MRRFSGTIARDRAIAPDRFARVGEGDDRTVRAMGKRRKTASMGEDQASGIMALTEMIQPAVRVERVPQGFAAGGMIPGASDDGQYR